jgi:DNA-binding PadR family transcriptional regulator
VERALRDESLGFWFRVEAASVQSMLRTLVRERRARRAAVERTGRRVRTVYRITRDGRAHLRALLRRAWASLPVTGDALQLALAARPEVEAGDVAEGLRARAAALRERLGATRRLARAAPAAEMIERERVRLRAELAWTRRMLSREAGADRRKEGR